MKRSQLTKRPGKLGRRDFIKMGAAAREPWELRA